MTKARLERGDAAARAGVGLILAAALAASSVQAAENVERDDAAAAAHADADAARAKSDADAKRDKAERDREAKQREKSELDAKLADAQKRLEKAASEVAQLSQQIATRVVENMNWSFSGTRRTVIGVQLEPSSKSGEGAKVQEVSPGGPAEQAGIRVGDVVVAVNGTDVKGEDAARDVVRLLRGVAPDTKVKVRVLRDGKPKDFDVTARPFDARTFVYRTDPPPGFPAWQQPDHQIDYTPWFGPSSLASDLQGMECTTLTPQLGKYFGADKGVLIVRAPKNSETLKLQDGDVILNVDGREPNNGSHLTRILRSYQPGEKLVMRIMRDRKPIEMALTVPEARNSRRADSTPYGGQSIPQSWRERQQQREERQLERQRRQETRPAAQEL